MTNHCPDDNADPARRNAWGVDLNRNYRVGVGLRRLRRRARRAASSDTYQGPAELSEPEAKNIDLARREQPQHQVHDVRALQRRPAVLAAGRVHRRRPHHHAAAAARPRGVLLAVGRPHPLAGPRASRADGRHAGERRRLVRRPVLLAPATCARTCTSTTASTRSAGRSAARSTTRPPATSRAARSSRRGSGDPNVVSGHSETMEYANGVMEMFRIADDFGRTRPRRRRRSRPARPVGLADGRAASRSTSRRPSTTRPTARRRRSSRRATSRPSSASRARSCGSTRPRPSSGSRSTPPATSRRRKIGDGADRRERRRRADRPGHAVRWRSAPPRRSAPFMPGVARDYTATTTANVISTAGDATLSPSRATPAT